MEQIHIVAAQRSPIGRFGGAYKDLPAADLAFQLAQALVPETCRSGVSEVILGQVLQAGSGMNVARQVGLHLGIPDSATAYMVNMVCGSSLKAVALGAAALTESDAPLVLAGGVENMSAAPYLLPALRWGGKYGALSAVDSIQADGLTDPVLQIAMGETAERIAAALSISRGEQDAFALESQQRVARSADAWARELVPMTVGKKLVTRDEHPRPDTTLENLEGLRPAFRPDGSVTAGNASGINDGAAMVLLARQEALERFELRSRARICAWGTEGCDPALMGLGPVGAIRSVLRKTQWPIESVDAFEINEAFAVQALGCIRQLGLSPGRVNLRGGAIALGHPVGASGARVLVTLLHLMEDHGLRRGIASLCIGGGMGIALAIERNV